MKGNLKIKGIQAEKFWRLFIIDKKYSKKLQGLKKEEYIISDLSNEHEDNNIIHFQRVHE